MNATLYFQYSPNDEKREKSVSRVESDQEEECSSSEDEDYGDSRYDKMVTGVQNGIKDAYKDNKKGSVSIPVSYSLYCENMFQP